MSYNVVVHVQHVCYMYYAKSKVCKKHSKEHNLFIISLFVFDFYAQNNRKGTHKSRVATMSHWIIKYLCYAKETTPNCMSIVYNCSSSEML